MRSISDNYLLVRSNNLKILYDPALAGFLDLAEDIDLLLSNPVQTFRSHPNLVVEVEGNLKEGSEKIVIKRFGWRNRLHYFLSPFRHSKALRSWEAAVHLLKNGLPTPQPIGVIEERKWGFVQRNYYIAESLGEKISLRNYLEMAGRGEKERMLVRLGKYVRSMHDSGLLHRDLLLSNFFLKEGEDQERLYLIDLNRSKIRSKVPLLWRVRDLVRIRLDRSEREIFLRSYSEGEKEYRIGILKELLKHRIRLVQLKVKLKRIRDRCIYKPLGKKEL